MKLQKLFCNNNNCHVISHKWTIFTLYCFYSSHWTHVDTLEIVQENNMKKWQTFILLWFFNLKKIVKNYLRTLKKPFAANFKRLCQNSKEYGVVAAINIIILKIKLLHKVTIKILKTVLMMHNKKQQFWITYTLNWSNWNNSIIIWIIVRVCLNCHLVKKVCIIWNINMI